MFTLDGLRNAIVVFKRRVGITLSQATNNGISWKINSSRLYRCLKMNQTQNPNRGLFFWNTGYMATAVTSEGYATICLSQAFGEIKKTNRRCPVILHQGNTSCLLNISPITNYLSTVTIELIGHRRTILIWHHMTCEKTNFHQHKTVCFFGIMLKI